MPPYATWRILAISMLLLTRKDTSLPANRRLSLSAMQNTALTRML